MSEPNTIEEILDFAIAKEEEAAQFYTELAAKMANPNVQQMFRDFSREELGHKAKLLAVKQGKLTLARPEKVMDLKIADYVVDQEPQPEFTYQQALILAMKREKASFRLYTDLANQAEDANVRTTFLALAQEEAKHKLRFELEYDQFVLTEN
ncbi:MAG: ferritin family protein [Candidatus Sumerlaeia bacterium]|nr:ferritin family protein [Candidatus Sumerlaeia bacterium]